MNKLVYLGLLILAIDKIALYEYWYDYAKPKHGDRVKPCYTDTDSFIINVKSEDVYADLPEDLETKFDTSNYLVDRPLLIGKNKRVIRVMKDDFGGRIMKEFVGLRQKTYSYLSDDDRVDK